MANQKPRTKHKNNQRKGDTQISQPDLRFAIQQRSKAKSERGRAQQKQPRTKICHGLFFRPTPDGSRQVVYQAGKTIALCKFTKLMQWQHQS